MRELAAYRVRAVNLAPDSENRIHDDAVARDFGFRGGLVPGITTYAYMTRLPAALWGAAWLEAGTMAARFSAPVYDGDEITVRGEADEGEEGGGGVRLSLQVEGPDGTVCATGEATLPERAPDPPDPGAYPEAPLPHERPPASLEVLEATPVLGTVRRTFRAERQPEFLSAIADDLELYRSGVAHPGWIIYDANQALVQNLRLGPWIHVSSDATHFSAVHDGEVVATRARVASVFDRKGHRFVELDVLVSADARPVWHIRHVAIYQIAGGRATDQIARG